MATFAAAAAGVALGGPAAAARVANPGPSPYGPLRPPDANGIRLPQGFRSRVLAVAGQPLGTTGYVWHPRPDGGAVFPRAGGGWTYVSNSEVPSGGGVGALQFDAGGNVVNGYRILTGTSLNCAGGPTPWGTWLSCEEHPLGLVHECQVGGPGQGIARPALGAFSHEAVAVDPVRSRLYLTEDQEDGELYRFTPANPLPDLSAGQLEVAQWDTVTKRVTWIEVPADVPAQLRRNGPGPVGTAFDGGEGIWYDRGHVYFTTKGTNRVYDYDLARGRLTVMWDASRFADPILRGVDNLVVDRVGNLYVAEDGGNMELVLITRKRRRVAPFLRVVGQDGSEIAGPAFSPDGRRLYFSSQRGGNGNGITYEVRGPFLGAA
jgi:secreted PhoX family phosphatase